MGDIGVWGRRYSGGGGGYKGWVGDIGGVARF